LGIFYKDCPHCAATHAAAADLCGCGYVFSGEKLDEPELAPELAAQEEKLYEAYLAARLEQAILEARDAQKMADIDPQNQQKAQIAAERASAIAIAQADFDTQARKTAEAVRMAEITKSARAARHRAGENATKVVRLATSTAAAQKNHAGTHRNDKSERKPVIAVKSAKNKKSNQAEQRKHQLKQAEAAKRQAEQAEDARRRAKQAEQERLQAERAEAARQAELAKQAKRQAEKERLQAEQAEAAKQAALAEQARQAKRQAEQAEDARRRAKQAEAARLQEEQRRETERRRLQEQARQAEQAKRQAEQAEDARRRAKQAEQAKLLAAQAEAAKQARQQAAAALATRAYLAAQTAKAEQAMQAAKAHAQDGAAEAPGAAFRSAQAARAAQIMRPDVQECPNCTASVPHDAGRCGCGYEFSSGDNEMPRLSLSPAEQSELLRNVAFEKYSKHR
jgi:colicin import membrane protein